MPPESFKRKLAAILSADVAGYSRLMREDEEATIRTLTDYRRAMGSLIQRFRGRVVVASKVSNWIRSAGRAFEATSLSFVLGGFAGRFLEPEPALIGNECKTLFFYYALLLPWKSW